jgi:7,8-dihydroneopterin aldolase/epimerase/oxygenase
LLTIHLEKVRFHAYHGVHRAEALTGNEFELSLEVAFHEQTLIIDDLSSTINYSDLFELVKQRMLRPTALLETIAGDIINEIHAAYPFVMRIKISIFKLQAAIPYLDGKVGITLERAFNE